MLNTTFLINDIVGETAKDEAVQEYAKAAQWCNENHAMIIEDGEYFRVVPQPEPEPPTPEEIQKRLTDAVQRFMDGKAQELGYDNIFTAIGYLNSKNLKFKAEAHAFLEWRDDIWEICFATLDQVKAGEMEIPSEEDLLASLPQIEFDYYKFGYDPEEDN